MKYNFELEVPGLQEVVDLIKGCLLRLYTEDEELFKRNNGQGISERCMVFRLAHYLQLAFPDYLVDCDFNSSSDECGQLRHGKEIPNPDGTSTKRFVDIIVHSRERNGWLSDFICFEIKKWNNCSPKEMLKDRNNLKILTSVYGYKYGFHLIFGRTLQNAKWMIFERDKAPSEVMGI